MELLLFIVHKHPTKVAGISKRGSTGISIFDGIMNRHLYYRDIGTDPFARMFILMDNEPIQRCARPRSELVADTS